jgi:CDP-diglyceride synthetase
MSLGNTTIRVIVSVFAIPAIILISYLGGVYFLSFVLLIAGISFYEFAVMTKVKSANINVNLGILGLIFFILNSYRFFFNSVHFFVIMDLQF